MVSKNGQFIPTSGCEDDASYEEMYNRFCDYYESSVSAIVQTAEEAAAEGHTPVEVIFSAALRSHAEQTVSSCQTNKSGLRQVNKESRESIALSAFFIVLKASGFIALLSIRTVPVDTLLCLQLFQLLFFMIIGKSRLPYKIRTIDTQPDASSTI